MKILYTTEAVVEGGRAGHGRTADGRLVAELSVPEEIGGEGGPGTNPEQLFAVGYPACFHSGLLSVAQGRKLDASGSTVTAHVGLGPTGRGGRRSCHVSTPRTSCAEPTRSALTRTPRVATSTSGSASTAHSWNDRRSDAEFTEHNEELHGDGFNGNFPRCAAGELFLLSILGTTGNQRLDGIFG